MSKNLFCLSGQAITRKHELQAATANLVPQYGGTDPCQQGGAYFCLYLRALQHGRGAGDLNPRAQRADDVNINASHGAQQRVGLQVKMVKLTL